MLSSTVLLKFKLTTQINNIQTKKKNGSFIVTNENKFRTQNKNINIEGKVSTEL